MTEKNPLGPPKSYVYSVVTDAALDGLSTARPTAAHYRIFTLKGGPVIMTLDELTLDISQSIDVKADIGDVFRCVLHRLGEGSTNARGRIDGDDARGVAGQRWFGDLRRRHRSPAGAHTGDQNRPGC
jgi:hypothetical protein